MICAKNVVQLRSFTSYDGHSAINPGIKVHFLPLILIANVWFCFKVNRSHLGVRLASACRGICRSLGPVVVSSNPYHSSPVMGIP